MRYRSTVAGLGLALGIAALGTGRAAAQVGVAVRASTLGAGGEVSYRAGSYLGFRVGGNYFQFTRTSTIEGIEYDLTPKLKSGSGIVDLHPFRGAFHLSAGVVWNSNQGDVVARLSGPITIGNQTYQPAQVGSLTGLVDYDDKYAPYLGLGFGGRGRVSLLADFGVVFSGHPRVRLTGSPNNLSPQEQAFFDQNVQQEVQEIQNEINRKSLLKYHPVVSLGLRIGI